MFHSSVRPRSAVAAAPAIAATAGEYSSDEMLVERIAAGDKLAMQVLFARHRTNIYRWLLRFVGNETVAEDLLSDVFFDVWQQAGSGVITSRQTAILHPLEESGQVDASTRPCRVWLRGGSDTGQMLFNSRFRIFPVAPIGNESLNSMMRGYL